MIKAVIFDMDGLLIDSEMISYYCYRDVLNEYGYSFTLEDYIKDYPGRQLVTSLNFILANYDIKDDVNHLSDLFRKYEKYHIDNEGVSLKDGALELINYLKANNYKTIIATSSRKERAEMFLKPHHILEMMDDVVYGFEVEHGKPAPDIFLKACDKLGCSVDEALVLEDSEAGIDSAYSANIKAICIPDLKKPDEIHQQRCTCLSSLNEVIEYLKNNR